MMNPKSAVKVKHAEQLIEMNTTFAKMIENPLSDEYALLQKLISQEQHIAKLQDQPVIIKSQFQQNRERKETKAAVALQQTLEKMKQQNNQKK